MLRPVPEPSLGACGVMLFAMSTAALAVVLGAGRAHIVQEANTIGTTTSAYTPRAGAATNSSRRSARA